MSLTTATLLHDTVSLTNCDREPIHIPGAIQPYGFLLCLDEQTQAIAYASANTEELLGLPAAGLLGAGIGRVLGERRAAEVATRFAGLGTAHQLLGVRLEGVAGEPFYKLILHRYDGLLWLEFEPVAETDAAALDLPFLNEAMSDMLAAGSVLAFSEYAAGQVRAITGFDRVAIYRFAADESGEVIAEAIRPGLSPWLGLRYPASDIPQQARAMYLKNWLRFIPDARYRPVPLLPAHRPGTARPPDMTYAVLRSVSPIHLEYLHHLGSAATMTISLIQNGALWGMITCHHEQPRLVSYELRDLCQFIGKTFSALLASKEKLDEQHYQLAVRERQTRLFEQVAAAPDFVAGLTQYAPTLADVFACGGAAVCVGGQVTRVGHTPTETELRELLASLPALMAGQPVLATAAYAALAPAGLAVQATASGFVAAALAEAPGDYLLWFRPEVVQTITWAGRHEKPQHLADGQVFLSPRQSFEAWKQTVEHTSTAWLPLEVEAARAIRQHVSDVRLKLLRETQERAQALGHLNLALERSNEELDSFAYVASHDLREPLRGIHNYSVFLLEDYADRLDADGVQKLQTLVRLSERMEGLIEALLLLARAGRVEPQADDIDLNELVAEVLDLLRPRFEQTGTVVRVAGPLPTVQGDWVQVQEVWSNLLVNAMKYSERPSQPVLLGEATATSHAPTREVDFGTFFVFYVQDQGIGIEARYHETIFKLFKRLHAQNKYGGGTGAGLAIARKMIERHGGSLWVESELGAGATFYFTIPRHYPTAE